MWVGSCVCVGWFVCVRGLVRVCVCGLVCVRVWVGLCVSLFGMWVFCVCPCVWTFVGFVDFSFV